jgi:hypothetical protein
MPRFTVLAAALLVCAILVPAAPHAASATTAPKCPATRGTLAKDSYGRVWHRGASLYGCTTVYGRAPHARRLGPWKPGTKVAWDGSDAVFSVPLTRGGTVVGDRLYAADAQDGRRWLLGTRAVPATAATAAREARVQRVFARGATAGWVTKDGAVVFALRSPEDAPAAEGALGAAPFADGRLTLVGTWPAVTPTDLGRTVRLDSAGGDGDECGGSEEYRLTLVPDAASGARVGVRWFGGWSRPFCG